ncbi:MAG: DUF7347 domain-containing protein [Promethearchaeota archaeon]
MVLIEDGGFDHKELNKWFQVLSNTIRIKIFKLIAESKSKVIFSTILKKLFPNSPEESSKVSNHLSKLVSVGFILKDKEGYYISPLGAELYSQINGIEKLFTKFKRQILVRTSDHSLEIFNSKKIKEYLLRETDLSEKLADDITKLVSKRLESIQIEYITAPLLREYINGILLEIGREKIRAKLTRLGVPPFDVKQLYHNKFFNDPELAFNEFGKHICEQYLLLNQLEERVADFYLSGKLFFNNPESFSYKVSEFVISGTKFIEIIKNKFIKNLASYPFYSDLIIKWKNAGLSREPQEYKISKFNLTSFEKRKLLGILSKTINQFIEDSKKFTNYGMVITDFTLVLYTFSNLLELSPYEIFDFFIDSFGEVNVSSRSDFRLIHSRNWQLWLQFDMKLSLKAESIKTSSLSAQNNIENLTYHHNNILQDLDHSVDDAHDTHHAHDSSDNIDHNSASLEGVRRAPNVDNLTIDLNSASNSSSGNDLNKLKDNEEISNENKIRVNELELDISSNISIIKNIKFSLEYSGETEAILTYYNQDVKIYKKLIDLISDDNELDKNKTMLLKTELNKVMKNISAKPNLIVSIDERIRELFLMNENEKTLEYPLNLLFENLLYHNVMVINNNFTKKRNKLSKTIITPSLTPIQLNYDHVFGHEFAPSSKIVLEKIFINLPQIIQKIANIPIINITNDNRENDNRLKTYNDTSEYNNGGNINNNTNNNNMINKNSQNIEGVNQNDQTNNSKMRNGKIIYDDIEGVKGGNLNEITSKNKNNNILNLKRAQEKNNLNKIDKMNETNKTNKTNKISKTKKRQKKRNSANTKTRHRSKKVGIQKSQYNLKINNLNIDNLKSSLEHELSNYCSAIMTLFDKKFELLNKNLNNFALWKDYSASIIGKNPFLNNDILESYTDNVEIICSVSINGMVEVAKFLTQFFPEQKEESFEILEKIINQINMLLKSNSNEKVKYILSLPHFDNYLQSHFIQDINIIKVFIKNMIIENQAELERSLDELIKNKYDYGRKFKVRESYIKSIDEFLNKSSDKKSNRLIKPYNCSFFMNLAINDPQNKINYIKKLERLIENNLYLGIWNDNKLGNINYYDFIETRNHTSLNERHEISNYEKFKYSLKENIKFIGFVGILGLLKSPKYFKYSGIYKPAKYYGKLLHNYFCHNC